MSEANNSDSSTSESEVSACSSNFDPMKALYSKKAKVPVQNAPMYENIQQYEAAQKSTSSVIAFGEKELVEKREQEKKAKKLEEELRLQEKNRQRFAQYEFPVDTRRERKGKNVLTRIEVMEGPLSALKACVDQRLRIKVTTHSGWGVRGVLHATLVAFDKQWNLALSDVLEIWTKKAKGKRKIPPMGTPVPKGTAAKISPVPIVTETRVRKGVFECTRHMPQLLVRGEQVVMINIVER
ncbi:U7 snRNA-associated Sm-like protein LSm11 [Ostrinia nubilalis]|uniref:U7 snRNA-associated Sm-like protein LSm11 n=1 Tax=Ostrinia nubilalis TaxID=29057 RepID=UPI0030823128